jgi:tRNA-binding EMAP/Myf-like protein
MADFAAAPPKPLVDIAALDALDIRVGTIVSVADVPRRASS